MKVAFCNPPWWLEKQEDGWLAGCRAGSRWPFSLPVKSSPDHYVWGSYCPYPFFMGYAASYVQRAFPDATVVFRDDIALRASYGRYYSFVRDGHFDFVFIESASPSWEHDQGIIKAIHHDSPQMKIVVTGPIATRGEEILATLPVHAVIRGEYEKGAVRVLNGESGVIDFDFLAEEEMNEAPPPFMSAMYAARYWDCCPAGQATPQLHAWTSRGCWAKCAFCVFPAVLTSNDPDGTGKRTVRHYHAGYLRPYLAEMIAKYKFRCLWLDDDLFNTSERHVLEVCEVMTPLKLKWSAMCRSDRTKRSTWQAMKDSGCFAVKVGMESASQRVLDEIINKQLDLSEAYETLRWLKEIGITVHTTWSVGHPGERRDEQQQTIAAIKRLYKEGLHATHQLSGTASIEGTPLHTIGTGKVLAKYPGAKLDESYVEMSDGAKKLAAIGGGIR